ncbi:MAG: hypothetical protein ACJ77K_09830 [Bacteroidia bacterium]
MRKVFYFLLLFLPAAEIQGQSLTPGYMGKRFSVGITGAFSPNFNILYRLDNPHTVYPGPVMTIGGNMEYVLSDRKVLCLSARYFTRNIPTEYYDYNAIPGAVVDKTRLEKMRTINYSVGLKRFSRKEIAPLGFYQKYEAFLVRGSLDYQAYELEEQTGNGFAYTTTVYPAGKLLFKGFGGGYSIGKQRVFFDKMLVDYGARGTMMICTFHTPSAYLKQIAGKAQDANIIMLNVFVGINFLAF